MSCVFGTVRLIAHGSWLMGHVGFCGDRSIHGMRCARNKAIVEGAEVGDGKDLPTRGNVDGFLPWFPSLIDVSSSHRSNDPPTRVDWGRAVLF